MKKDNQKNETLKNIPTYLYNGERVVLLSKTEAEAFGLTPVVDETDGNNPYKIGDVMEIIDKIEPRLTYEDSYSSYAEESEIIFAEVENFENPNSVVIDWCSKEWLREAMVNELGLSVVSTTSERNGYPSNIKEAYIGFDNYEDAEKMAYRCGMQLIVLDKREGWNLWHRGNSATEAFHITSADYGDNYCHFNTSNAEDYYEEEIKPYLEDFDSIEELEEFLADQKKILEEIENLEEGQLVITSNRRYYDTINEYSMSWCFDSKHYTIGIIDAE